MNKKSLLLTLGLASCGLGLGIVGGLKCSTLQVRAEDEITTSETTEIVDETETSEVVVEAESESELTQWCKDTIAIIQEFFSQPLVIGGVSTTIGSLAILIISKAVGSVNKGKLKDLKQQLEESASAIANCVAKKDYNQLLKEQEKLLELCKLIIPTIKNINTREQCEKLLAELTPVKEEVKEFAVEEHNKVVEDTKVESEKVSSQVIEILQKD